MNSQFPAYLFKDFYIFFGLLWNWDKNVNFKRKSNFEVFMLLAIYLFLFLLNLLIEASFSPIGPILKKQ